MSSSPNISHDNEEINSPDQVVSKDNHPNSPKKDTPKSISSYDLVTRSDIQKNPSKLISEVENINNAPLNEGSVKNDETFVSNKLSGNKVTLSGRGDGSLEPNNDDNDLELRYDDDLGDDDEILNEDALLKDNVDLEDDLNKGQEEKNNLESQDQYIIPLEKDEKIAENGVLENVEDISNQTNTLGEAKNEGKEDDNLNDLQDKLLEVGKEPENLKDETSEQEKNQCTISENQKLAEIYEDVNAEDENKADDTIDKDNKNTSTLSQDSSFKQTTEHGLNEPDMMLEIPTQELIEFSDEDNELEGNSFQMSPEIDDVIDLEDNLVDMDEEHLTHVEESVKSSVDIDMTVLAEPKTNPDASQVIVHGYESREDVNKDVADTTNNDITRNSLSYEAEIAADIITKEMNNIDVETFIKETEVIQEDNENPIEELITSLENEIDKETTVQSKLEETADVIELSDDNIDNELEDSGSSSAESLPDQKAKIENSMESVELDEDILNEAEEIDNLILTSKISKTKLREDDAKSSANPYKSSSKTCEKSKPNLNTNVNVNISIELTNKVETEPEEIVAMEISNEISICTPAKILGNITSDELAKEGMAQDVSYQSVLSPNKIQITTLVTRAEVCRSKQDTTVEIKPVSLPDNQLVSITDSKESSSKLNMVDLALVAHSESSDKQNTTSDRELHISKSPVLVKLTAEPNVSKIGDPMSSTSNIDTSEIIDCKGETVSSSDDLKSSKLEVIAENPSQYNKEFVSSMEESMDIDVIEQSEPIIEIETSETGKQKLCSSNTVPKTSKFDIPQSSLSKIELKITETCKPTLLTSNIELTTPETDKMAPSIQMAELITSRTVESTPSLSKVEPITIEACEPITTESSEPITIESCKQTPSTTLESMTAETVTCTSMIEPKITETVDSEPQNSALNIEMITTETCEPTPSTSKCEPSISETVDPTQFSSKPIMSETVVTMPSTSKIELISPESIESANIDEKPGTVDSQKSTELHSMTASQTSESMEPQPSTSKCDTEELEPKPSSPKDQPAFDSLVQDSSNDVPEMTDSLGLLAESSRVMEDDDEHDDDDDDDGEDEDDSEPDDESSNQVTAEHSEDSNAHHSESDGLKDAETPNEVKQEFDFNITKSNIVKEQELEKMVCDESEVKESSNETVKTGQDEELDENKPSNEKETKAMDVETVKLSDTSDTEDTGNKEGDTPRKSTDSVYTAKTKKLSISKQECVSMSYVDLEESSSDEDKNPPQTRTSAVEAKEPPQDIVTEDISSDVPQNETTEVVKETETTGSGSPKPALEKDEVKPNEPQAVTKSKLSSKADIPKENSSESKVRSPMGLEVFSLDSDEEDSSVKQGTENKAAAKPPLMQPKARGSLRCINRFCANTDPDVGYHVADTSTAMYFEADKSKRAYVCQKCNDILVKRNQELIEGMKNFTPLYQLHTARNSEDLVEISDSDSDDEPEPTLEQMQLVGKDGAKMLEEKLADMFNETWEKFKMDDRLEETKNDLQKEMEKLQKECQEIDAMFDQCQAETDKLRNSLYATFEPDIQELPAIIIFDKPNCSYTCLEPPSVERRQKRALSPSKDNSEPPPAKKPVAPTPAPAPPPPEVVVETAPRDKVSNPEQEANSTPAGEKSDDDSMDISVVTLATEAAPPDLPPPGDLSHPAVKVGMTVYAMKNAFGTWLRAKVVEIQPKTHNMAFTMVRVRFEHKVTKNPFKTLPARCLAYFEPSEVRMTIGTRVIALFKDITCRQAYYSGIVAEIPNPVNKYRYLIFFDDGYAQYAPHSQTRLVCEFSSLVWEEVHPYSREFVRSYLLAYPERPMVRLHAGQNLKTEWRGKWWSSRVLNVDSSLVEVQFLRCDRREWIYRGSTRLAPLYLELQAAERHRPRALPRTQPQARVNMPYVEYTRSDEQANKQPQTLTLRQQQLQQQQNEEIRRQRAVAKKSTALPQPPPPQPNSANLDNVTSRVVYYTPKNAVKPHKMKPHTCSPQCKRTDVLALKDLRTYNPLAKPLLSGWERQIVRFKGHKAVMYVAPCGRRLRAMRELHRYLRATDADMPVDLFDFSPTTHCLAEFVLNKCFVGKKDLSHGKEIVPVPCVNYYDDSLPEFCSYNTERTPTAGVPLNLDPEFLCGCDCEDDCEDKTKCACWKMTLEGARTIGYEGDVGYVYRRLPEPLPSGIYECNSRCKCKNTCLNRVAQHPLQLKLQVFKTLNRGWGIRALNDVPKGAFLCIYAGNLLTDATANLDGLNEGDEYLAELDYIEVVEQMKEGFEEDIPDKIKAKDKKALEKKAADEDESSSSSSSEEETSVDKNEREDGDFQPMGYVGLGVAEFNKRLRRRSSKKEAEEEAKRQEKEKEANADEECITISDDEEVREPSCFTAAVGMGKNQFISKYRSVRTLFGEDEACYIMDAKVQGNIGRYLNHSCTPNVFVQNVFVDTHDPRFPWVAFFALHHIRAGTELTWNYNYDVGSVPGKVLYCFCGAQNCRGRLL